MNQNTKSETKNKESVELKVLMLKDQLDKAQKFLATFTGKENDIFDAEFKSRGWWWDEDCEWWEQDLEKGDGTVRNWVCYSDGVYSYGIWMGEFGEGDERDFDTLDELITFLDNNPNKMRTYEFRFTCKALDLDHFEQILTDKIQSNFSSLVKEIPDNE